jgi:hypothetical protein
VQSLQRMGTMTFESLINRITKKIKNSKNCSFARTSWRRDLNNKLVEKCILVSTIVLVKEPYLHPCVQLDIYLFSNPLYCKYMPTMGIYPQNAAFKF